MSIKYNPNKSLLSPQEELEIKTTFSKENNATLYLGDCLGFLRQITDKSIQLIVTSPPYNIGKEYETKLDIQEYVTQQSRVIDECIRVLNYEGEVYNVLIHGINNLPVPLLIIGVTP